MGDEKGSGGEEGPRKPLYTPHLKRVLKSYQAAATTSLHGPDSIMGSSGVRAPGPTRAARREPEPFVAPPPFPIQQPPLFAPADQGEGRCERSETVLEGETISCFCVGGEERLCLPQILNTVLQAFSLHQINGVCDSMHIFCSRCNSEQLEVLKAEGVLPLSAPSCGLITKTDAERLCAALVDPHPPRYPPSQESPFKIPVYHECFGRCKGTYSPDLYCDPGARCIECAECKGVLSPQKFVCHAHHSRENRTCHWGFDSFRWRSYLLLDDEEEGGKEPQFKELLKQMKSRFDYNHKYKRKQILAESCDPSVKRVHVDCGPPPVPYGTLDPSLVCWYGSPLWGRPGLIAGPDGKAFYLAPALPDSLFKDRLDLGPKLDGLVSENQVTLTYHVREERKLKKEPTRSPCRPDSSEDALSDTSFSTLSAGTEDGLVSNVDDLEEEVCPTTEGELRQLDEILTEVEAPLRTKILTEVESLIAKYRKCLSVAVQGKKLYQMELEKFNYVQRGKIRKLRETNKYLEKKMRRLQQAIGEESGEPPPPPEGPGAEEEEEEEKPSENEPFSVAEGGMQDAEEMCDSAAEGPTDP